MNGANQPSVSVVIPVRNEAAKIRACIEGILSQTIPVHEIIVIDSGSSDGTTDILKQYPEVTLVEIPAAEFNHGETRNLGVKKASGDYILLTVGDARPFNNHWIEALLKGFIDDKVVGVCGQQVVPHEKDKNPIEWFNPISEPNIVRYQFADEDEFEALSPLEKKNICCWDDVSALYRRSILQQIPFQKITYGEDALWAKEVVSRGHAIVYNFNAKVYHYHNETPDFVLKRSFTTMYFRYRHFGYLYAKPLFPLRKKLSMIRSLWKYLGMDLSAIYFWFRYNLLNFRALAQAHKLFMSSLDKGESALDETHQKLCNKPPIPLKSHE